MTLFITSIVVVLVVSGLCSLSEASLYAVRTPHVRQLAERGSRVGSVLHGFKQNMQRPIAAILIMNTIANTAGAAVAGGQARQLFGEAAVFWFAAAFTFSVLLFAEIIPKVVGVTYNQGVARLLGLPVQWTVNALYPLVRGTEFITQLVQRGRQAPAAPEEEVQQLALMSAEEGSILPEEAELVQNVLRLNDISAREILTPRSVVFKLSASQPVKALMEEVGHLPHSRVPVHASDDPDHWTGVALRRDILRALAKDDFDKTVGELARPIHVVPDTTKGHTLLKDFLKRRAHLFGVVNEYGDILGVVTLEDVLESLIGEEIVDETDATVDLRALAFRKRRDRFGDVDHDESPDA